MILENVVQLNAGLVPTRAHTGILNTLKRALLHGYGAMSAITGIAGIGKTTTINAFGKDKGNVGICTLSRLSGGAQSGLIRIANELGEQVHAKGVSLEDALKRQLWQLRNSTEDHNALLVIDEAQHASVDLLEEIRYLGDMTEVGIALVGNQQLRDTIRKLRQVHPQISSRIVYDLDLAALDVRDLELICKHRNVSAKALDRIRELSGLGGAFRTVNHLLKIASERGGSVIDLNHVNEAALMMGLTRRDQS